MAIRITILVLVIAAVLALTEWHESPRPQGQGGPQITLRFWNGFTGPDGRTMLQIVRRFQQVNPDIHIIMQRMDWGTYYNKLFVAGMGGRAPEVFVLQSPVLTRFARARLVRPLGDMVNQLPVEDVDPAAWRMVQYDGQPVGLPLDMSLLGQFYNRAMLKRVGMVDEHGAPRAPRNKDEMLDLLRKVKAKDPQDWGFIFADYHNTVYALMMQFGGRMFTDDGMRCTLGDPRNVEALEFCRQMIVEGLTPNPANTDAWLGFQQGKVATAWHGIYMLGDLQRAPNLDYAGAPIPTIGPHHATWVSSHVLCLRPDLTATQVRAAQRFIVYLSDHSLDWASAGQVPVRRSLRESERFKSMQVQSAFAEQIPYMHYEPAVPFTLEYRTEYDVALEQAIRGTLSPKEALEQATARINRIIEHDRELQTLAPAPPGGPRR
jgi:multiple sugar transport system substrate-binding protein